MSNKNNNQNTNVEEKKEEQQENAPVNEAEKTEAQKPAEQKDGEFKKFLCWEVRKAPKKNKASDEKTKPAKDGKWGLKKAATIALVGVTTVTTLATAATKVAEKLIEAKYGNGDGGYSGEDGSSYEQQAIEGQYQEVPAENTSSEEN